MKIIMLVLNRFKDPNKKIIRIWLLHKRILNKKEINLKKTPQLRWFKLTLKIRIAQIKLTQDKLWKN